MLTNKDIRVENGNIVINGDKYPLDGQSPEAIMQIVEDNSDTTPTENSDAPITSGGVYTALGAKQDTLTFDTVPTENSANPVTSGGIFTALSNKQDVISQANFVDCSVSWPSTGTDAEKVSSIANQVFNNISTTKPFTIIAIKDGASTLGEMIYAQVSAGNYGIGIFMSYYINGIYRVKNVNGTATVVQLAEVS